MEKKLYRGLLLTADDMASQQEVDALLQVGEVFPEVSASLLVTTNKNLVRRNRALIHPFHPGLHIDWQDKLLRRKLSLKESNPKKSVSLDHDDKEKVRQMIHIQIADFQEIFGMNPHHVTYHLGFHHLNDVMEVYSDVNQQYNFPFRWASQYTNIIPTSSLHPDLFVDLHNNIADLNAQGFLYYLQSTVQQDQSIAEVCLHLGQNTLNSRRQTHIFSQKEMRNTLFTKGFTLTTWEQLKQEKMKATIPTVERFPALP